MATPSFSATLNFVKKYPITLCGFSLLFMPSVHRLLLYFTPLLLSTAIFIIAMMSWGPSESAEKSTTSRRSKPKLMREHPEWALNESMAIDNDNDDQGDFSLCYIAASSCLGNSSDDIQNAPVHAGMGSSPADRASATPACGAEPDPDLQGEGFRTAAKDDVIGKHVESDAQVSSCLGNLRDDVQAAPERPAAAMGGTGSQSTPPDGQPGTPVGDANHRLAEPEPDLQGEGVGTAAAEDDDDAGQQYVECDEMLDNAHDDDDDDDDDDARVPDIVRSAPSDGHAAMSCALQGLGHAHEEEHEDVDYHGSHSLHERVPHCLKLCA